MNEPKKRGRPSNAEIAAREQSPAQSFAARIWANQSPSLPRKFRLERVKQALERKGLSMEGVTL